MSKYLKIFLGILAIFTFSCSNYRYFTRQKEFISNNDTLYNFNENYKLQTNDYLYISIKSTNKDVNDLFDIISSESSNSMQNNESNLFLSGYVINDSGFIFIPTIGDLYIKGMTINEAKNKIKNEINKNISDAVINVRLASFNVSFLGEVSKEGRMQFYKENLNIIEALAQVGGVSDYGDKRHVRIFRQAEGKTIIYEIDLTNLNLMSDPKYYLQPNDIVYIPPLERKIILNNIRDYSTFITILTSSITTALVLIQLFKK